MNPTRRLALLALILGSCLAGGAPVCSAQTSPFPASNADPRYATRDTTILRDTLGLTFERLFPLADSLRRAPEDLKLMSATWRWSLARLVKMADSLDVPIDSVGPRIDRERFNPLANVALQNSMTYTSIYAPSASGNSWGNTLDHNFRRGPITSTNNISVTQQQNGQGGRNGTNEQRSAHSNLSWRFSNQLSAGADALLGRIDDVTPSGLNSFFSHDDNYGFSVNARPHAFLGITPTLYTKLGIQSTDQLAFQKHGFKWEGNGSFRSAVGWFTHDVQLSGSTSNFTASPTDPNPNDDLKYANAQTLDSDTHVHGSLNAFRGRKVELTANYQLDNTRIHTLTAVNDTIVSLRNAVRDTSVVGVTNSPLNRNAAGAIDATLRIQPVNYGSLDVTWKTGKTSSENSTLVTGNNSGNNHSITSAGRLDLGRGITLQGNFAITSSEVRYPKRDFPRGGYGQDQQTHDLSGTATVPLGNLLTLTLDSDIQLGTLRYSRIASPLSIPVAHDDASQNWRITISPGPGQHRMSNTIGLKVARHQQVNLPASSTASNTDERTYTGTWNWTYLLLTGLSANQTNSLVADYTAYPFSPASNNASLTYTTTTILNADLGPRFRIVTTHFSQFLPKGNYRPQVPDDPTQYLSLTDESLNYSLDVRSEYSLLPPFVTLNADPIYSGTSRNTAKGSVLTLQRKSRTLNFRWGANLNLPVGKTGSLRGDVTYNENATRNLDYTGSPLGVVSRSATRALAGTLTFTITL